MKEYPLHYQPLSTGETMAYRSGGKGKPILLIHGNQSSSVHWQPFMDRLDDAYRFIAVDMIGYGDSTYNKGFDSLYEMAVHIDALMRALDLDHMPVIGWSAGGGVAMELAASFPDRVSELVLLGSVGVSGYPIYKIGPDGQPIFTQRLCSKKDIAMHPVSVKPVLDAFSSGNREFMKAVWNAVIYQMKPVCDDDFDLYLDAMFKQRCLVDTVYALSQFNLGYQSNGCTDGTGKVDALTMPVTILQGRHDLVVPCAWAQELKAAIGDNATLHIFENGGHSLITDSADEVERVVRTSL